MYSVIRFIEVDKYQMEIISIMLNEQIPDFCDDITPNPRNDRCFSFSLSAEENWWEHHEQIRAIISKIASPIDKAREQFPDLQIQIDLEVGYPDYSHRLITEIYWTPDLLCLFLKLNVTLVTSIYYPDYDTTTEGHESS